VKLFWELVRSGIVGIIGTIVNLLGLFVFVDYLGVYYAVSSFFAYCVNFVILFFGDKYYTFRKHDGCVSTQFKKYFTVYVVRTFIKIAMLVFLVEFFVINYMLAQLISMTLIGSLSFFMLKFWIFHSKNN
jgi:putative flippase GtrA